MKPRVATRKAPIRWSDKFGLLATDLQPKVKSLSQYVRPLPSRLATDALDLALVWAEAGSSLLPI